MKNYWRIIFISFILLATTNIYPLFFLPYDGIDKRIVTEHFVVVFPAKYEKQGIRAAKYAEEIHEKLTPIMNWKPKRRTTILLSDHTDFPNGMALPFLRNIVTLYLAPSDYEKTLQDFQDPLYSMLLHEYSHTLHLDQIRGAAWFWRVLYGKLYHPHVNTFRWYMEGIAVNNESKYAGGGRLNSSYNDAFIRTAARERKIPSIHKMAVTDMTAYHYGAKFVEYLKNEYGEEKFNAFIEDLSNDFWPFILLFVMKHKKIYGKSLKELWNEWAEYEYRLVDQIEYDEKYEKKRLTDFGGDILSIDRGDDFLLVSSSSYNEDNYVYKLYDNGSLEKIHLGYHRTVSLTNNNNYFVYTSPISYPAGFQYFELFSYNFESGLPKRLTFKKRVNYVSFAAKSPNGVFVSHTVNGAELYKAVFDKGNIYDVKQIKLPAGIQTINSISISPDGLKVLFTARLDKGKFRIFIVDMQTEEVKLFDENIIAKNIKWIDSDNASFTAPDGITDSLYGITLSTKRIYKIVESFGLILMGIVDKDNVYYVDYTYYGEEVFLVERNEKDAVIDSSLYEVENDEIVLKFPEENYEIKNYFGSRHIMPTVWGFLPYQLDSYAYFNAGNLFYFPLPFIGPQFMIYNVTPKARLSYTLTVALDYLRLYPENSFSLNVNLPFVSFSYNWNNWAGGYVQYVSDHWERIGYNGRYPVCFSNSVSLHNSYSLLGNGVIGWDFDVTHIFREYSYSRLKSYTNEIYFSQELSYQYIKSRQKATRWDRGIYLELNAIQYPENLLDNFPKYLFRWEVEARAPVGKAFFFALIEGGVELLKQNVFYAYSEAIRYGDSENGTILGISNSQVTSKIDTKAFLAGFQQISSGSAFVSSDIGFDITFVKKTIYWYFATMGFKEFYMKTFAEFVYLYNEQLYPNYYTGILFDAVVELGLDLFIAYGNITTSIIIGNAIGYRVGDDLPAVSVYCNFNLKI